MTTTIPSRTIDILKALGIKKLYWIDDKFFRELFFDTELIMNVDKFFDNSTPEEIEDGLKNKYNKQLNRLNKLFNK